MPSTELGFTTPSLGEIVQTVLDDINANLSGEDARNRGSDTFALGTALAGGIKGMYGFARFLAKQILPDRATVEYLERHASIWGITRTAAAYAAGTIEASGTVGATIPAGTIWETYDGTVQWEQSGASVVGGGGTVSVSVTAVEPGSDGNAVVGTLAVLGSEIAGIDFEGTVDGAGIIGGTDEETDDSLRDRLLDRIRDTPQGGAEADYVAWVKASGDVDRVFVTANELGWGTVGIRFTVEVPAGGVSADAIPAGADVTAAQNAVDAERPVTADVTVTAISAESHTFTIAASPDTVPVRNAITAELNALFIRKAEPGGTIYESEIIGAMDAAAGEDYSVWSVLDGGAPGNITIGANGWPTVGVITWV